VALGQDPPNRGDFTVTELPLQEAFELLDRHFPFAFSPNSTRRRIASDLRATAYGSRAGGFSGAADRLTKASLPVHAGGLSFCEPNAVRTDNALKPEYRFKFLLTMLGFSLC
jgi:hypothetical protein